MARGARSAESNFTRLVSILQLWHAKASAPGGRQLRLGTRTTLPPEATPGALARHHPLLFHSSFRGTGSLPACPGGTIASFVNLGMKPVGRPDARNGPVRFDEQGWETGRRLSVSTRAHP